MKTKKHTFKNLVLTSLCLFFLTSIALFSCKKNSKNGEPAEKSSDASLKDIFLQTTFAAGAPSDIIFVYSEQTAKNGGNINIYTNIQDLKSSDLAVIPNSMPFNHLISI